VRAQRVALGQERMVEIIGGVIRHAEFSITRRDR
jgi:hypothetical protein